MTTLLQRLLSTRHQTQAANQTTARQRYRQLILALANDTAPDGTVESSAELLDELGISDERLTEDLQRCRSCLERVEAEKQVPRLTNELAKTDQQLAGMQAELEKVISAHQEKMNPVRAERGLQEDELRRARQTLASHIATEDMPPKYWRPVAKINELRQNVSRPRMRLDSMLSSACRKVDQLTAEIDSATPATKQQLTDQLEATKAHRDRLQSIQAEWEERLASWTRAEKLTQQQTDPETGLFLPTKTPAELFGDLDLSPIRLPVDLES